MNKSDVILPSNRKFGAFLALIFLGSCVWALIISYKVLALTLLFIAFGISFITAFLPNRLAVANKYWMQLGLLLGRIINPVVLGLIFFGLVTPISLITKLFGRDELRVKVKNNASYWIKRSNVDEESTSFKNQY